MSARLVDLADAVVAALNTAPQGTFPFTAERLMTPPLCDDADEALRVMVVPRAVTSVEARTRRLTSHTLEVSVGIRQRLADVEAEAPALCALSDAVVDYLQGRHLNGFNFQAIANAPAYNHEALANQRVFLGIVSTTYTAHVAATQ